MSRSAPDGGSGAILPGPMGPDWLTTAECADELGMSRWYVRERIEDGDLPAIAMQGGRTRYRVHRADLDRYRQSFVHPVWEPRKPTP